jgi:hypothetical protein
LVGIEKLFQNLEQQIIKSPMREYIAGIVQNCRAIHKSSGALEVHQSLE